MVDRVAGKARGARTSFPLQAKQAGVDPNTPAGYKANYVMSFKQPKP